VLWIDSVQLVVGDLERGATRVCATHGLAVADGGRRLDGRLASRVVPLGGAFLELVTSGDEPGWSVATDELARHAERLGRKATAVEWVTPEGGLLRCEAIVPPDPTLGLPALRGWPEPTGAAEHPATWRASHGSVPLGIRGVAVSIEPDALERWLGPSIGDLPLHHVAPPHPDVAAGVEAIDISLATGRLVLDPGGRDVPQYAR
jgi:hypothetical protein